MREHNFSIPEWSGVTAAWSDGEICINAWNIPWIICNRSSLEAIRCLLLTKSSIVISHFSCSSTSWQEPAVLGWSEHVSIAMAASYLCNLETIVFNFYCLRFTDWRMKAESRLCRKTTINYVEQRTDHFCRIGCWWKETRDFSRSDIELREIFDFDLSSWLLLRLVLISNFPCELDVELNNFSKVQCYKLQQMWNIWLWSCYNAITGRWKHCP